MNSTRILFGRFSSMEKGPDGPSTDGDATVHPKGGHGLDAIDAASGLEVSAMTSSTVWAAGRPGTARKSERAARLGACIGPPSSGCPTIAAPGRTADGGRQRAGATRAALFLARSGEAPSRRTPSPGSRPPALAKVEYSFSTRVSPQWGQHEALRPLTHPAQRLEPSLTLFAAVLVERHSSSSIRPVQRPKPPSALSWLDPAHRGKDSLESWHPPRIGLAFARHEREFRGSPPKIQPPPRGVGPLLPPPPRASRGRARPTSPPASAAPSTTPAATSARATVGPNGETNPAYPATYVFDNDFPALKRDGPEASVDEDGLLVARTETGRCRVICFSPRHDLTLAEMTPPGDPPGHRLLGRRSERPRLGPAHPLCSGLREQGRDDGVLQPPPPLPGLGHESDPPPPRPASSRRRRPSSRERGTDLLGAYLDGRSSATSASSVATTTSSPSSRSGPSGPSRP